MITTTAQIQSLATQVPRDIVRMVHAVQSGHPGGSLGCVDFMTALYNSVLNHDPNNFTMDRQGQDMFFQSNGHLSAVWYSVLAHTGYFPLSELVTFRKLNSQLQGHPTPAEHLPGVRVAPGLPGQGLSVAVGAALAKRLNNYPNLVYTIQGDGGQTSIARITSKRQRPGISIIAIAGNFG